MPYYIWEPKQDPNSENYPFGDEGSVQGLNWGPDNEDPTIWGTVLGSPIFGNPHIMGVSQNNMPAST